MPSPLSAGVLMRADLRQCLGSVLRTMNLASPGFSSQIYSVLVNVCSLSRSHLSSAHCPACDAAKRTELHRHFSYLKLRRRLCSICASLSCTRPDAGSTIQFYIDTYFPYFLSLTGDRTPKYLSCPHAIVRVPGPIG